MLLYGLELFYSIMSALCNTDYITADKYYNLFQFIALQLN